MKIKSVKPFRIMLLCVVIFPLLFSCEYKDIADTHYPPQEVYMQGSLDGIYVVNSIEKEAYGDYRYKIDAENNQLLIPLTVYRAGVDRKGTIRVDLATDPDTIRSLITSGGFTGTEEEGIIPENEILPELLPAEAYTLPASVQINNGDDMGRINLSIDIAFIMENMDKRYALAVKIEDASVKVSSTLHTLIIDFSTDFVSPHPVFGYMEDKENSNIVYFTNLSTHCLSYEWIFPDGTVVTDSDPEPYTFPGIGKYPVTLRAEGITGKVVEYTRDVIIWENITASVLKNPGNPFVRVNVAPAARVDILEGWSYTPNVLSSTANVGGVTIPIGGYMPDNGGVMDFYATTASGDLENAKIYQSFELSAGSYRAGFVPYSLTGNNECYYVIAKGDQLPDITDLDSSPDVLGIYYWNQDIEREDYYIEFELTGTQKVTMGFVMNTEIRGRVKIQSVSLFK